MISVIIPVYNESKNIKLLYEELYGVLKKIQKKFEIIIVNDGSTDDTLSELIKLSNITIISMRRSFGQTACIDAGVKHAKGQVVVTMDGDLQNDPHDIPRMLEALNYCDGVIGWRKQRKDTISKRLFSFFARKLRKLLFNDELHDAGCGLKAIKKICFTNLDLYGEMHRFIHLILISRGFSVTEIPVKHRQRISGKTNYDWTRTIKAFADMLSVLFWRKFSNRPLHLFGSLGFILILIGLFGTVSLAIVHLIYNTPYETMLLVIFSTIILGGIQLFVSGIAIDIAIKSLYSTKTEEPYYIKSIVRKK